MFSGLICKIYTAQFFVEEGETAAILEAETFDGTKLRGEDIIRIVQGTEGLNTDQYYKVIRN